MIEHAFFVEGEEPWALAGGALRDWKRGGGGTPTHVNYPLATTTSTILLMASTDTAEDRCGSDVVLTAGRESSSIGLEP